MCGICGFTGPRDDVLLDGMTDIMAHRGPNDRGVFICDDVSLGHRRLSIIDLSGGRQPIFNEDGSVCIVYNGEIYNHLGLRRELEQKGHRFRTKSDTEVIVHLYEEMGSRCVERLNGMFAFGIWDGRKKRLFLARDRLGIKPLYYAETGGRFLFASEIKSLLQFSGIRRQISYQALDQVLTFSCVSGRETIFQGIYRLEPGHVLTYEEEKPKVRRYWRYRPEADYRKKEEDFVEEILYLLEDAVKIRLMSEVPLGATLSGGLDSSAVVAFMSKALDKPVRTFSVGFNEADDELPYAKIVADRFRTEHSEYIVRYDEIDEILPEIVWHLEDPIPTGAIIPTYFYSKAIKGDTTVTLIGEGSDELFAGYKRFKYMSPLFSPIPNRIKNYAYLSNIGSLSQRLKNALLTPDLRKEIDTLSTLDHYHAYFQNGVNRLDSSLAFDLERVLPEYHLMRIDKLTMCHSIEARVPFLDYRLVELAATIPSKFKIKRFNEKHILRKCLDRTLPEVIVNRKKRGLNTPIHSWFDKGLDRLVRVLLSEKSVKDRGLFNVHGIDYLMKNRRHPIFGRQYSFHILKLLYIELWHSVFIDNTEKYLHCPRNESNQPRIYP